MHQLFKHTAVLLICGFTVACGNNAEKAASSAPSASASAAAPTADASWPHGDALCDLIATHFASMLPANAERHPYPSGDMCKVGGSSPGQPRLAQVRVVATSRGGMTPVMLASYRVAGDVIGETPDLGDGAFSETFTPTTQAAKINFVTQKNGHLITIEIEFARPITDADAQSAHNSARDFVAAL